MAQPVTVIIPDTVTDATLIASSVPEDETAWASAGTYALGDQRAYQHVLYECVLAHTGITTPPAQDVTRWLPVRPTNRWRALDASSSTRTAQASSISYTLRPGRATTAAALIGVANAADCRIRAIDATYGTAYDKTADLHATPRRAGWWHWYFGPRSSPDSFIATDLPSLPSADIQIDLSGGAGLSLATLVIGRSETFGLGVPYGVSAEIVDYSRYEENQWGDLTLAQGKFSDRVTLDVLLEADEVDDVRDLLTSLRATPCVWQGYSGMRLLTVFGYYKSFRVVVAGPRICEVALELRSMT